MSDLCPHCLGVPEVPDEPECHGCYLCNFEGTTEGVRAIEAMHREANEAWDAFIAAGVCPVCKAASLAEARKLCRPPQTDCGDDSCDGDHLWEAERAAERKREQTANARSTMTSPISETKPHSPR